MGLVLKKPQNYLQENNQNTTLLCISTCCVHMALERFFAIESFLHLYLFFCSHHSDNITLV